MDPDVKLLHIKALCGRILMCTDNEQKLVLADKLVDYISDLDTWLKDGGFLPSDWNARR